MSTSASLAAQASPRLTCTLRVPASVPVGAPVPLTLILRNASARPVAILTWGTPFEEAWFEPFVTVRRGAEAVAYAGAQVKRGEPEADEYLRLSSQQRRQATLDLAAAFDVSVPGRYTITPRLLLHDIVLLPGVTPRPRSAHVATALVCAPVTVTVSARRTSR